MTRRDGTVRIAILTAGVVVGVWVVFEHVGVYPTINHCPQSEYVCPSQNIRNVIPAAVGTVVALSISAPLLYGYDRVIKA